ncbi:hypothetical protein EDB83DRAFT_2362770 [Lactarius deliciosus]|nr:hypothetical protein EDB83DRAFT_2362770 [Lactarius deliciosus]
MLIGGDEARGTVRVLYRFLENEVDMLEGGGGDAAPPGVFYAVAQAVFLIFCFQWKEFVVGDDEGEADALASSPKEDVDGGAQRCPAHCRVPAAAVQGAPRFFLTLHITSLSNLCSPLPHAPPTATKRRRATERLL